MTPRNERQVGRIWRAEAIGRWLGIFNAEGSEGWMCGNGIRCVAEWLLTPGGQNQTFYQKRQDYALQMELFCCGDYWRCEICAALDAKYREDEP